VGGGIKSDIKISMFSHIMAAKQLAQICIKQTSCIATGARLQVRTLFARFWSLGPFWGYLATSDAKSDVIFLLCDSISYKGDEISRLSRLVFEIWRGQTDRRQTRRRPLHEALTLRPIVCEPNKRRYCQSGSDGFVLCVTGALTFTYFLFCFLLFSDDLLWMYFR